MSSSSSSSSVVVLDHRVVVIVDVGLVDDIVVEILDVGLDLVGLLVVGFVLLDELEPGLVGNHIVVILRCHAAELKGGEPRRPEVPL